MRSPRTSNDDSKYKWLPYQPLSCCHPAPGQSGQVLTPRTMKIEPKGSKRDTASYSFNFSNGQIFSGRRSVVYPERGPLCQPRGQAFHSPLGVGSHCPPVPRSAILLTFSCTEMEEGGKRAFYNQIIFVHSSAIMLMHREARQMVQSQLCWC